MRGDANGFGRKLATLARGTILGELALLDGRPRSATAYARGLVCYSLTVENFVRITRERPDLGRTLLAGLGRELARRMRMANRIATELKG